MRLGSGPLPRIGQVKQETAEGGYLGSKPQSCERTLGARLQVRPVPSGSTFRDLTMPSSITMENLPERRAGPREIAWAWRLAVETGGVAGERPTGDPPTFTSSVVDSQRDTPVTHQVTDLSPERGSRKMVRNPQNRPGPLATPHTGHVPPSPCFQDGGWECTHLPKGPTGVCKEPNLRRKQKSQKKISTVAPDPLQDPQLTLPSALWARAHS